MNGIVWPGKLDPQGAAILAHYHQLTQSEYFSPDELFNHQRRQLRALFSHAVEKIPFYQKRFAEAGFDPSQDITPETIRRLPLLTRADLQLLGQGSGGPPPVPPGHGTPFLVKTSGSTGVPAILYKTQIANHFTAAFELRRHAWAKRDLSGSRVVINNFKKSQGMLPNEMKLAGWGSQVKLVYETGPGFAINVHNRIEAQAEWLARRDPDYLATYPSNLAALLHCFEQMQFKLTRLREVATQAEMMPQKLRDDCRRLWGVGITDTYSCREIGPLAQQCPDHEHYHVQSENIYLEVVDENDEPCPIGKPGRVLVTHLHNFATPLIRYEMGDFAELGDACSCGRGLPVIKQILGRVSNKLVLPDGNTRIVYLGRYRDAAALIPVVRQFQVIQHSLTDVENKLVVSDPLTSEQEETLKAALITVLGHPFDITFSYYDDLPRAPSGKFEEFISKVDS